MSLAGSLGWESWTRGSRAWVALAALLAIGSLAAWSVPREDLDWQPLRAWSQPWRAFTAVAVHYSALHLGANLVGTLLVGALGAVAELPGRIVWAWLVAWPLTQLGLLVQPELLHYGGLSGVLHAGVAAVAVHLVFSGPQRRRRIGAAILVVLCAKVLSESPWGPALRHPAGWDIAVAPIAHASGVVCGALCAGLATLLSRSTHG